MLSDKKILIFRAPIQSGSKNPSRIGFNSAGYLYSHLDADEVLHELTQSEIRFFGGNHPEYPRSKEEITRGT